MHSKFLSIPYRGHGTITWLCPILIRSLYIVYTYGTVKSLIGKGTTARVFYTFLEIAWAAGERGMETPVPPQLLPEYMVHSLLPYPIAEMLGGVAVVASVSPSCMVQIFAEQLQRQFWKQLLTTLPSGFTAAPSSRAHRSHSQLLFLWDASCLFILLDVHYICLSADQGIVSILTDIFHEFLKSTHTSVKGKGKFFCFWALAICSLQPRCQGNEISQVDVLM